MSIIEWSNDLEVGHFEIDSQHRLFVGIINRITEKVEAGTEKEMVESLLVELLKYTEFHFCSEENFMIEHNYPELLNHKREHEDVLATLQNRVFSMKYDYIDFDQLQKFLIDWFTLHTSITDAKFVRFLKGLEPETK
jgi:hemerythrin-like metal-binding protein